MSEYDACVRGSLKIKGDSGVKKKKKKKNEKKLLDQVSKIVESIESEGKKPQNEFELTKAEMAFLKQQEKMQEERIKKKASMTHKQRVEEFNKHLDSLTEHFDIPKEQKKKTGFHSTTSVRSDNLDLLKVKWQKKFSFGLNPLECKFLKGKSEEK